MMARTEIAPSPETFAPMDLFRGLSAAALEDVLEYARLRRLLKGTVIFSQGDVADRCHALIMGRVRISQTNVDGQQVVVRFIGPREMFGTIGLFTDRRYPADATVIVDCIEASWAEAALFELMARHPTIAINALRVVGSRLQESQDRLRELATECVERRIAHAILRLVGQAGRPEGDGIAIDLPLTRQDIGELTGTAMHTVSRMLAAWEQQGIITGGHKHLVICDLRSIEAIADELPPG